MQLTDLFDDFLEEEVNLNKTRLNTLENRVETIKTFILNSEYEPEITRFSVQGSWAHKTIIKPSKNEKEFDADLVIYVKPIEDWEAKDYLNKLKAVFKNNGTYKKITGAKSRCVTLDYSGDFHLDIVPIVHTSGGFFDDDEYEVCNRTENQFEKTDGDGFAEWWAEKNALTEDDSLIKTARLLKYLRDTKGTFSVKSILLTTLIGSRIGHFLDFSSYPNVPKTLKLVLNHLDNWLQENAELPEIENPVLEGESFTRHWDQEKYENFRNCISRYREWIDDAYEEEDRIESIKKWQRVFGANFGKQEIKNNANQWVANFLQNLPSCEDVVTALQQHGKEFLIKNFPKTLPHVQKPPFRKSPTSKLIPLDINAYQKSSKDSNELIKIERMELLEKGKWVQFDASIKDSGSINQSLYKVKWQVVNTDKEAYEEEQLRGDFYDSDFENSRIEKTEYRGIHWVKAYLVHRKTRAIHGQSGRFFVAIK